MTAARDPLNDAIAKAATSGNRRNVWLSTIYVWRFELAGTLQNLHNSTFGRRPDWIATLPPRTPRPLWIPPTARAVVMAGDETAYLWNDPDPELALKDHR
jgi:hypothetical protein